MKELYFSIKLRSMYWIKAIEGSANFCEFTWWNSPVDLYSSRLVAIKRNGIVWQGPKEEWLKFNVDGAARGKPGKAGCGGVLRDGRGDSHGIFYGPLGILDSNMTELYAISKALQVYAASPWCQQHPLIIESDSKTAVFWVTNIKSRH